MSEGRAGGLTSVETPQEKTKKTRIANPSARCVMCFFSLLPTREVVFYVPLGNLLGELQDGECTIAARNLWCGKGEKGRPTEASGEAHGAERGIVTGVSSVLVRKPVGYLFLRLEDFVGRVGGETNCGGNATPECTGTHLEAEVLEAFHRR